MRLPLIRPNPQKLGEMIEQLRAVEASGIFSNNGPTVQKFERELTDRLFGGKGECLAIANATLGLMMALRQSIKADTGKKRLVLIPSFTFAATAHAAVWAGLTPLLCDIDPADWIAAEAEEERLLRLYGRQIAAVMPYATFGADLDLDRYRSIARRHEVAIVIDAAASLGTIDARGNGYGQGSAFPIVFSMHATKPFATAEGGVIYSTDARLMRDLRRMANFGFGEGRSAVLPGLNAKLPEVLALLAIAKLGEIDTVCDHRTMLEATYRAELSAFGLQSTCARRQALQFMSVLLPRDLAGCRDEIISALAAREIGSGHYFSPHLAEQAYFAESCIVQPTPVADDVGSRILSLPITDMMTPDDARFIAGELKAICGAIRHRRAPPPVGAGIGVQNLLIIGGGPAGTALLTAAAKQGQLAALAHAGLTIVEREEAIGPGRLGQYAITSDSTADTFLTAALGTPYRSIDALLDDPSADTIAGYREALGVPLSQVEPFLRIHGDRLQGIAREHGASILTGHEAIGAQQMADGLWCVTVRRIADGSEFHILSHNIAVATGGHQPVARLQHEQVAGVSLVGQVGNRLLQSDELLKVGGLDLLRRKLGEDPAPKIAVIGGSTSAIAVVTQLLKASPALPLGAGAVTLLHRRPLHPFYPSAEAARADGFDDFGDEDICPISGFVYRLGGFRLEARDLILRMLRIGGREPDDRLRLHRITEGDDPVARGILEEADLVIAALGYRPYALPLFSIDGKPIALLAQGMGRPPMVDKKGRLVAASGQPISGAYGIGLGAGFVPSGALGGEPSFVGQANGLWLWQNGVGMMIIDQILPEGARAVA